jgi:hypothetical protein
MSGASGGRPLRVVGISRRGGRDLRSPYPTIVTPRRPASVTLLDVLDTIYLPINKVARVVMVGRDNTETIQPIDAERFESSDLGVFTVAFERDTGIAVLTPVEAGTATLQMDADAIADNVNEADRVLPLTDTLTIIVYRIATEIRLYYEVAGTTTGEVSAKPSDVIRVPSTAASARIRVEGVDARGRVVPLSNVVFDDTSATRYSLAPTDPPDPQARILTPLSNGSDSLPITADGDPSPDAAALFLFPMVSITTIATHLTETYSLGDPDTPPPSS